MAPRKEVKKKGWRFLVDQKHRPNGAKEDVTSHLLCILEGAKYPQYVEDAYHDLFHRRLHSNRSRSDDWGEITDRRILDKFPGYKVMWLCRAEDKPGTWVGGVLEMVFAGDPYTIESELEISEWSID